MTVEIFFDDADQILDAMKTFATNTFVRDLAEPPFDHVQPGARCWDKVEMKSWMPLEPGYDVGMLVSSIIVYDQMQIHGRWSFRIDLFQEPNKFLMPVSRHAIANHLAVQHAQCGKQCGGAVALVIMRHRAAAPLLHRESGLRAVKCLYLAFLVNAQDNGLVRRIEIKPNDIVEFFDELFVAADFERLDEMRLETVLLPDSSDRGLAKAECFGHASCTPMRGVTRRRLQSGLNNSEYSFLWNARNPSGPRSVFLQPRHPEGKKAFSPKLHGRAGRSKILSDILTEHSVRCFSNNLSALNQSCRNAPAARPSIEHDTFFRRQDDRRSNSHAHSMPGTTIICQAIYDSLH